MDFFEHQDQARRNTFKLVGLFTLAVIVIVIAVNAVVLGALHLWGYFESGPASLVMPMPVERETHDAVRQMNEFYRDGRTPGQRSEVREANSPWLTSLYVTLGTLVVILGGTLYKLAALSRGGSAVARMLGGRLILPNTTDPDEQKLRNVVEEMAIASGTAVPELYLLENERGINAFAAGFTTRDAVIGVTRGCIRLLDRDELQGVIAHEFSHILHGDMRLNLRLIGVLHGILVIALLGYEMVRSLGRSRGYSSGRRGNAAAGMLLLMLIGVALIAVGYIGVFFGRLIQSAVSRQREFLADASAVQFTRNPAGVTGALKKIGGYSGGTRVDHANAFEASHMFFGSALASSFGGLLATHPPLIQRIRRIEPAFDGRFAKVHLPREAPAEIAGVSAFDGGQRPTGPQPLPADYRLRAAATAGRLSQRAGNVSPEHVRFAVDLLRSIPSDIAAAAREPFGARAVVYCLLLDRDRDARLVQLDHLRAGADPQVYQETLRLIPKITLLGAPARLPLLDLTIAALRNLSPEQLQRFMQNVKALTQADQQVALFEYALWTILQHHLNPRQRAAQPARFYAIKPLLDDAAALLSAIAFAGGKDAELASACFHAGMSSLGPDQLYQPNAATDHRALASALDRIADAAPGIKRRVLDAAAQCASAEGHICPEEAELLRAIAAALDCPIPPILASSTAPAPPRAGAAG